MPKGERNMMLLFLAMSLVGVVFALTLQLPEARLFPLITAIITAVLILSYFVIVKVPALHSRLRPYIEDDLFLKISEGTDVIEEEDAEEASETLHPSPTLSDEERQRRERMVMSYVVGFGALAYVIGLTLAAPVFMLALMLRYSKESILLSVIVTAATNVFIYLVFSVVLRVPPHLGLLGDFL